MAYNDNGPRRGTEGQDDMLSSMITLRRDAERYLRFRRYWELKRLRRLPMHYGLNCYCERRRSA